MVDSALAARLRCRSLAPSIYWKIVVSKTWSLEFEVGEFNFSRQTSMIARRFLPGKMNLNDREFN